MTTNPPAYEEAQASLAAIRSCESIPDEYETYADVERALRNAGLESSNLIIGIDFTASNDHQGERTFGGKSLHALGHKKFLGHGYRSHNPYQQALEAVVETLSKFDDDHRVPMFAFGDSNTRDTSVRSMIYCGATSSREALNVYADYAKTVHLSGPTSFVPLIEKAISIVKRESGLHFLVIIADGAVTNIQKNAEAIVRASHVPLSIIMVGVGDGPWDTMEQFDDHLTGRAFDNFQFVNFEKTYRGSNPNLLFALNALMEAPAQYRALVKAGKIG